MEISGSKHSKAPSSSSSCSSYLDRLKSSHSRANSDDEFDYKNKSNLGVVSELVETKSMERDEDTPIPSDNNIIGMAEKSETLLTLVKTETKKMEEDDEFQISEKIGKKFESPMVRPTPAYLNSISKQEFVLKSHTASHSRKYSVSSSVNIPSALLVSLQNNKNPAPSLIRAKSNVLSEISSISSHSNGGTFRTIQKLQQNRNNMALTGVDKSDPSLISYTNVNILNESRSTITSKTFESNFPTNLKASFRNSKPADKKPALKEFFTSTINDANPLLKDWSSLSHVDLIHRQGLKAPPMVFESIEHSSDSERSYYQLLLPQTNHSQSEAVLCCRKKSSEAKFRFSLDPNKMTKRDNPNYVGKMTCKSGKMDNFLVTLASGVEIATISIISDVAKHSITMELLNQYLNAQESGRSGRVLTGLIQSYMQPYLALEIETNHRGVLSIYNPLENDATQAAQSQKVNQTKSKYIIEYDYPLTIFLSFCVICAAQASRGSE